MGAKLTDYEMDLADLRVMVAIAAHGSFTRAAQKLGISQPAVSRRVTAIEQALHVRMFRSEGRHLVLSEAGIAFCERAKEVLALMQDLPSSTARLSGRPGGTVALGLPPTTGELLAPKLLPEYRLAYPDVFVRLEQGYVNDLFEMLIDKRIDVALLTGNFNSASIDIEPLYDHHVGIVYPRAWDKRSPLDGKPMPESLTLADAARLPLVLQSPNQSTRQIIDAAFRAAGLKPNVVMEANSFILQKSLVMPEIGCMFMSRAAITDADRSRLGFVPISDATMVYSVSIATRKTGQPTLAATLMIQMIKRHMVEVTRHYEQLAGA
jgi:LysR family transcriptional regulator, nitrogen assimilation regulatory protein